MFKHEIYTASASDAREMASAFDGAVNSYNIAPDEEMFIVSITNRFNHKRMMAFIHKATPAYDYEEVITNKLKLTVDNHGIQGYIKHQDGDVSKHPPLFNNLDR